MKLNVWTKLNLFSALIIGGSAATALATGFRLPDQDAFATARGEAFVATADNPSAIYYNPAGIAQLQGNNFRGGLYGIYLDPNFKPLTSDQTFHNENNFHVVPQFFYTHGLDQLPLTFGLGVYSPFGLSSKWPQDTGFRTVSIEASVTYITINPAVAWRILPNLSVGAGISANYADASLQEGLVWPTQSFDKFGFSGDGWAVGYNLGALWSPHEKVSLGVTFRSSTQVDLNGHTEYYNNTAFPPGVGVVPAFPDQRVSAEAKLPFPLSVVMGVSYRPTPKWNFEFNADYADWSTLGTVTVEQAHGFPPLIAQNVPVKFDWQPSWYYEFGGTRYLNDGWSVSAGYIFNENSVPDTHYSPTVADLDRHFFSVGAGHKGKVFDFDVAYQFGYGPTRTVTDSVASAAGQTANGRYEFFSHAIFLTVGVHF
jgi:long-chain fatty acid transport protein